MSQEKEKNIPEIVGMQGIVDAPVRRKLREAGITNVDELWSRVGVDAEQGLEKLEESTQVPRADLVKLLSAQATREAKGETKPKGAKVLAFLGRHRLELVLACAVLLLLFLTLRAAGCLTMLQQPLGLHDEVVVANKNLETGHVLKPEDLVSVRMVHRHNHFRSAEEVKGLILTKRVRLGTPLHSEEVLRLQLVAKRDVPLGTILSCDDLSFDWTPYQQDAAVSVETLLNGRVTHAVRAGEVFQTKFVERYQTSDSEK